MYDYTICCNLPVHLARGWSLWSRWAYRRRYFRSTPSYS